MLIDWEIPVALCVQAQTALSCFCKADDMHRSSHASVMHR